MQLTGGRAWPRKEISRVRFEARDLKPYAEPVDPSQLRVGQVYREGSRYDSPRAGAEPVFHHGDAVKHMFEYERALDTLLSCSLKRSGKGL
jgi:hypothetical protein